jgi:hypothetical protein
MKQNGLGDYLIVGGYEIANDIGAVGKIDGSSKPIEWTGIDKSAYERTLGTRDGKLGFTSFFNPAAGRSHEVLKTLPDTDTNVAYLHTAVAGADAAVCNAKRVSYNGKLGKAGEFTFDVEAEANGYGLEWGTQLCPGSTSLTGAGSSAGVDFSAATSFGLQLYLHVTAFTGTDCTVKVQESSDNGSGDAWADVVGGTFAQTTGAHTWQRIQTTRALAVERYLRTTVVTTGGFSALTYLVVAVRNQVSVAF